MFRFKLFFPVLVVAMLTSCAIIDDRQPALEPVLETSEFSAWQLTANESRVISSNRAVGLLLSQADDLISVSNYEQAADKLERLVRIDPQFAQAWSRLAWLALKNNDAERSRQLAQRSISYSRDNNKLKLLNWHFIKKTGELLQNETIVRQAEQMIRDLGGS